jgi:hypothetical protein
MPPTPPEIYILYIYMYIFIYTHSDSVSALGLCKRLWVYSPNLNPDGVFFGVILDGNVSADRGAI